MGDIDFKKYVRDVPDFPKPGINFKDIQPLLRDRRVRTRAYNRIRPEVDGMGADGVICVDSRGFLMGPSLASDYMDLYLARKKGKLPRFPDNNVEREFHYDGGHVVVTRDLVTVTYKLEYGTDTIEISRDGVLEGQKAVIADDVLATGGTAEAVAVGAKTAGLNVVGAVFLIELEKLGGRERLKSLFEDANIYSMLKY